MLFSVVLMSIH